MMRVTNSMIVKRTKTNINANRANVDYTNNQMSIQKKITKPSDNPIIAIRSLRLRSTLSTITQYYDNNIPDVESWMECTQTALVNMKDLISDAYKQAVYGTNDPLQPENRQAILKELQSLQQQIYSEGNADYDRRTIFTGYKTNQKVTFMNSAEAKAAVYTITETFDYRDIDKKEYYKGKFKDTSDAAMVAAPNSPQPAPSVFDEVEINRLRLSYDNISTKDNTLEITYNSGGKENKIIMTEDLTKIETYGCTFTLNANGISVTPPDGYIADTRNIPPNVGSVTDGSTYQVPLYKISDWNAAATPPGPYVNAVAEVNIPVHYDAKGTPPVPQLSTDMNGQKLVYKVRNTSDLESNDYNIEDDQIVFDCSSGELLFNDKVAEAFDAAKASFSFTYKKEGFEEGELHPEYFFDCTKYTDGKETKYENFDENGEWKTQAIKYNIASGQQMQINTEARDVFDTNIRRDITELINVVEFAITAKQTVDDIETKIKTGDYSDDQLENLNKWLDAAKKQQDYANQNMHDTYSSYITKFQGYLDDIDLGITNLGGSQARVELTKNRMSVQKSTFKELKSVNEDMDLSDLVINYTAASVAYQAALQSAAKIGRMTLLDFI